MIAPPPRYCVDSADAASNEAAVKQTWQRCNGDEDVARFARHFAWFYLRNPAGIARVHLLREEATGQCVGMLGVSMRELILGGQSVRGGLLHDFVVAPAHRTLLPALLLQRVARAQALSDGAAMFGLPASKAVPIFRRIERNVMITLPRFARVIQSRAYLRRIVPGWLAVPLSVLVDLGDRFIVSGRHIIAGCHGEWTDAIDARFDGIWKGRDTAQRLMGVRDGTFLNWRFFNHPHIRYRALLVKAKRASTPHTYFVCEHAGQSLIVKDTLTCGSQAEFRDALLVLVREARGLSVASISLSVRPSEFERGALQEAGFVERDARPCFIAWGQSNDALLKGADWYLTPADEDV